MPKITTVEAVKDLYSITNKYPAEFSYTNLKAYILPYDVRIDEILVREGSAVNKGDKILKISLIDNDYLTETSAKLDENNRKLERLTKEYNFNKSQYSEKLYIAQLQDEIYKLEQEKKQQWYSSNGGADLSIAILQDEITVLTEENNLLINNAATKDDLAKSQLDFDMQNLLQSINAAQGEEEKRKLQQQYDLKKLEYDILTQSMSESKRALSIKRNTYSISEKQKQIDLLNLQKAQASGINAQIEAKAAELDAFKKTKVNETTLKLDAAFNEIEALKAETDLLSQSIEPLKLLSENGGYITAADKFTVHKISAGIDAVHPAGENIFTHTTAESKPCFKWVTDKNKFQSNFGIGSVVNVKYNLENKYIHEEITVSSKMQLADTTEYICLANSEGAAVSDAEVTMTFKKDEYVTYLPKAALHSSVYGERVVYAILERDSIFKRESYVKELPVEILAEDDRNYIVKILSAENAAKGYAAQISTPVKDGDVVKVVQQFAAKIPFESAEAKSTAQ